MTTGPTRARSALAAVLALAVAASCSTNSDTTTATTPTETTTVAVTTTAPATDTTITSTTDSTSTTTAASTTTTSQRPATEPTIGELDPALDNGAEGRNTFAHPTHRPPPDACSDDPDATATPRIVRLLPEGPLAPDGSLAFTSGICVYVPPGHGTSGLRYPVLFLLHGGGGDAADLLNYADLAATLDAAHDADPRTATIVVMPDGTDARWYDRNDGSLRNATYVLEYLVPYVDERFDTLATQDGRAIAGISNGGYGAMHLAATAPDLFVAAAGISSNLGAITLDPEASSPEKSPIALAGRLDEVDLMLDIAVTCDERQPDAQCFTLFADLAFLDANRQFVDAVTSARAASGSTATLDYLERDGSHSWSWWTEWLRDRHLPFLWDRLADPA
jgi:S-formylglutathione hydrolase FrmB